MGVSGTALILLAGGASRRMGQDKRRLRLWGEAGPMLLEAMLALAAPLCDERVVVLNDPEDWQHIPARLVPDAWPGAGPLGGLATGLAAIESPRALVLACDTPLASPALLQALIGWLAGHDAAIPLRHTEGDGGPRNAMDAEPLLAAYARAALPAIEAALERRERRLVAPLADLQVRYVKPEEWRAYDPDGRSFINLNRAEDVRQHFSTQSIS
jgi:molybdopterin-guanine dinucleotide biosynthesis protein A